MSTFRFSKMVFMGGVALIVISLPVLADELRGTVKSIDRANSRMVVHDELAQRDVVVNFNSLTGLKTKDNHASESRISSPAPMSRSWIRSPLRGFPSKT